ncbi:MAG TPA: ABC transporter permease [Alphaproteobacteria bacterium]|nr:ABC transporter permease [Alphaproteobacteria bacterium]
MRTVLPRALRLLLTTLAVVVVVFALLRVVPGDPVAMLLGDWAAPVDAERLRHALGLDVAWPVALPAYLNGLLHGDWGTSLVSGKPVLGMIFERLPATGWLGLAAMVVALLVGIPAGILLGLHNSRIGQMLVVAIIAVPTFVLGPLLIMGGAVKLGWFPVSGMTGLSSVVLPAVTLGLGMGAVLARLLAATLVEERAKAYGLTVAAKGGGQGALLHHWLRNALGPVVLIFCLQLGMVLTGTVLTEAVFGWPGIGSLLVEGLQARDYPLVQGCLILISVGYGLAILLADVLQALLDPRLRRRA